MMWHFWKLMHVNSAMGIILLGQGTENVLLYLPIYNISTFLRDVLMLLVVNSD